MFDDNNTSNAPSIAEIDEIKRNAKKSEQGFQKEMSEESISAIDTENNTPAVEDDSSSGTFAFNYGNMTQEPENDPNGSGLGSMFPEEETEQEEPAVNTQQKQPSVDKSLLSNSKFIVDIEDMFESRLLAWLAQADSHVKYQMTEDEKEKIAEALAKFKPKFVEKMDNGMQYLLVRAAITGPKVMAAINDRKHNVKLRKEQAAKNHRVVKDDKPKESFANVVSKVVPIYDTKPLGERTNYDIFGDGSYMYCRKTDVQKPQYRKQGTEPIERVDITNIEDVKRVLVAKKGGWRKLRDAFELPNEWLQRKGIDPQNIKFEEEEG